MNPGRVRAAVVFLALVAAASTACDPAREAGAQELAQARDRSPTAGCFLYAQDATTLLQADAFDLCRGAPTATGPVQCYLAANDRLTLTTQQDVRLCQCASNTEPVDCWDQVSDETTIPDAQIEELCAPRAAYGLLSNCRPVGTTFE